MVLNVTPRQPKPFIKKYPEIPTLDCYKKPPRQSFWNHFPKNNDKQVMYTPVNGNLLRQYVLVHRNRWIYKQKKVADIAVRNITQGTKVKLTKPLPPMQSKNANSAFRNGEFMTDQLAGWVKNKFVAGPFHSPPIQDLRVNMLMSKTEKLKVRPILNLSAPKGNAFNEAIDKATIPKLTMSAPSLFGQMLLQAGKKATFAKIDIQNAYKLVPVHPSDWKHFGFKWLGKFFYEKNTAFGNKKAPADFDPLPDTVVSITKTSANIPHRWVTRQLDDTIVVSPQNSNITRKFVTTFRSICAQLKIPLAADCPNFEKAFSETTKGTVLGVIFD